MCEIKNIKSPKKNKIDDEFAKKLGAKDLSDLTQKLKTNFQPIYDGFKFRSKKEILDQLEKSHKIEIPKIY